MRLAVTLSLVCGCSFSDVLGYGQSRNETRGGETAVAGSGGESGGAGGRAMPSSGGVMPGAGVSGQSAAGSDATAGLGMGGAGAGGAGAAGLGGAAVGGAGTGAGGGPDEPCSDQVELCGNQQDDDCDEEIDEGCDCQAVAPGEGGLLALSGVPERLLADPLRCLLYAIDSQSPAELLVIDTGAKKELSRIRLDQPAERLEISPDGEYLAASHPAAGTLSIVDAATRKVTALISASATFAALPRQRIAYATAGNFENGFRGRLAVRNLVASVETSVAFASYDAELQLAVSSDGASVFSIAVELRKWNVNGPSIVPMDEWVYEDYSVQTTRESLFASGSHVYVSTGLPGGIVQVAADDLNVVHGKMGEAVLAEDGANGFAVTKHGVRDAVTFRELAGFGYEVTTAALANDDQELWTYDPAMSVVRYANVADFIALKDLGQRELPAAALADYSLTRLIADPLRERLYAIDRNRNAVVAIDRATLQPLAEVLVGSMPSDFAIDPFGTTLFVGHEATTAFARIDLDSFQFDGLVPWRRVTFEIEALSGQRVAVVDLEQHTYPAILDAISGERLAPANLCCTSELRYRATLAASRAGDRLFVGESSLYPTGRLELHDVAGGQFTPISAIGHQDIEVESPPRWAVMLPDASGVFYSRFLLEGTDLSVRRYTIPSQVYVATPDGRVATTASSVLRISDGKVLGKLPLSSTVQASSPDSKTLYVWDGSQMVAVDLEAYQ